jgi:hypothetical protein
MPPKGTKKKVEEPTKTPQVSSIITAHCNLSYTSLSLTNFMAED